MEHEIDMLMGVILPYANFFIFVGLAVYFFRKPAKEAATKKRHEFTRVMDEAKKSFDEANEKLKVLQTRQANLKTEIEEYIRTSEQSAKQEAERIVQEAERLAHHLKEEAKRIASAEVQKARASLRQEIVDTVCTNVKDKISKEVTKDRHLEIVRKNISELKTIHAEG